jgi:hypothetical protein
VFLSIGIEVRAGRFEIRRIAFTNAVDMQPMCASRKFRDIERDANPFQRFRSVLLCRFACLGRLLWLPSPFALAVAQAPHLPAEKAARLLWHASQEILPLGDSQSITQRSSAQHGLAGVGAGQAVQIGGFRAKEHNRQVWHAQLMGLKRPNLTGNTAGLAVIEFTLA